MENYPSISTACTRGLKPSGSPPVLVISNHLSNFLSYIKISCKSKKVCEDQHHEGDVQSCEDGLMPWHPLVPPLSCSHPRLQSPPSPPDLPQQLVALHHLSHVFHLHLQYDSPWFEVRAETAGPCFYGGFFAVG